MNLSPRPLSQSHWYPVHFIFQYRFKKQLINWQSVLIYRQRKTRWWMWTSVPRKNRHSKTMIWRSVIHFFILGLTNTHLLSSYSGPGDEVIFCKEQSPQLLISKMYFLPDRVICKESSEINHFRLISDSPGFCLRLRRIPEHNSKEGSPQCNCIPR